MLCECSQRNNNMSKSDIIYLGKTFGKNKEYFKWTVTILQLDSEILGCP